MSFAACPATGKSGENPCPFSGQLEAEPDPGQKTYKGCTCKSSCGPDVTDKFNCDFCRTEDSCGRSGFGGSYDYCVYSEDDDFESKTFQDKNTYFWSKISADAQRVSAYPKVFGILTESIQTSFDNLKNEMPSGRVKYIHTIGSVCQFKLEISEKSPYTGLLGPGPQEGLIRMGSAADYGKAGVTPGLGFKFARTGRLSGDFVALHSLDLGQGWNFFAYNMSNHISPPSGALKIVGDKFQQASQCAPQVGLSDMAKYSQDGTENSPPKFPFKLFLVPSSEVQMDESTKTIDQMHGLMDAFPVGTTIFTVYACDEAIGDELLPTDGGLEKACGKPLELGALVTTSKCTTSAYGDAKLHIRHQRVEEDWQLRPDFLTKYDASAACGWSGPVSSTGVPPTCSTEVAKGESVETIAV